MKKQKSFLLANQRIAPGSRHSVKIPAARLYNDTPMDLHAEVFHGHKAGPTLLVCAAIHGDELNGIEVCRRLMGEIRSEEHTSELQSRPHLVCRLLLEKKKQ